MYAGRSSHLHLMVESILCRKTLRVLEALVLTYDDRIFFAAQEVASMDNASKLECMKFGFCKL